MSGFKNKLVLYQRNLERHEFFQSSSLHQLDSTDKGIFDVGVETYIKHIQELHEDIEVRFQDAFQLEILSWIIDPFI